MGIGIVGSLKPGESGQDSRSPKKMRPMNQKERDEAVSRYIFVSWKQNNKRCRRSFILRNKQFVGQEGSLIHGRQILEVIRKQRNEKTSNNISIPRRH